ncbi:MAG: (2Fe-2S)-binding protein [Acidobacteria bacterium]|nr:(2Fe-2S)-binding protein [Acidobacteriota bacterium]
MPQVTLTVNGGAWTGEVPAGTSLLELLRERAGVTGPKYGCGEGQCGSCAVLVDGRAVHACTTPASAVAQQSVTTVEGLGRDGQLHPVQQAFIDAQAFQCGFCTPGMITGAVALLARDPSPTEETIRQALEGHLCRCGTYPRIVDAVRAAGASMARERRRG